MYQYMPAAGTIEIKFKLNDLTKTEKKENITLRVHVCTYLIHVNKVPFQL